MKNARQTKSDLVKELESVRRKAKKWEPLQEKHKHVEQNITGHKRFHDESNISKEHYRNVIETSQDGLLLVHRSQGDILNANAYAQKLLGYSKEEFSKNKLWEIGVVKDDKEFQEALSRLERDGVIYYDNISVKNKAGLIVNTEVILVDKVKFIQCNIRDNTERKRAEEQLRQSEERFRLIAENAIDLIAVLDLEGKRIYSSPSYKSVLGDPESLRGTDSFLEIHPEDREKIRRIFQETVKTGIGQRTEYRFLLKDGSVRYIESLGSVIRDEIGNTNKVVVVSREVTERKQVEQELRESKALIEAVVENVPLMIFLKEAKDLRFVVFNRAGEELLGYDRKDLLGKNNLDLFPPEQAVHFMAKDREVLDGETGMLDIPEEPILTAKKGERLLHTRKICIKGPDGVTKYLLGISDDITERKQAEETTQQLAAIVESSDDAIIGKTLDGTITSWNYGAEKIYGYSAVEIVGRSISLLIPPAQKDELTNLVKQIEQGLPTELSDTIRVRKDGSRINVSITISPIHDGSGKIVGASTIARDITERKRAEKQIALLAHTLKSVAECVSITDLNDIVLFVNNAFLKTYGYSENEILGKNINVVRSPNNLPDATSGILNATLAGGWTGELMNRTKDGRDFPVSLSTSFVRDEQGQDIALVGIATDITERKLADNKLQESEQRYDALFERSLDLVYVCDFEGNFIDANDAALNLLGYTKEEIGSLNFASLLSEDQLPLAFKITQEIKKTGIQKNLVEFKLRCRNGQIIYVESTGSAIISNGIIVAVQSIARNITGRKQVEEKLSRSEEKYRTIFENVQDVYYETSIGGTILEISPSIEFISKGQYHRADLIGRSMFDFYNDLKDREAIIEEMQKTGSVTDFEVPIKNRDGSLIHCSVSAKINYDAQGQPEKFIGSMHDISERKRAESALATSEIKYRTFFENSMDAILLTSPDGRILSANQAACRMFDYSEEELIKTGKNGIININDPKLVKLLSERKLQGKAQGELTFIRKDGTHFPADISSALFKSDKGEMHASMIIRDITGRKKLETDLTTAAEIAKLGYWEYDVDSGNFIFSDQYYKLIHGSSTEKQGGNIMSGEEFARRLVYPDDSSMVAKSLQNAIASPDPNYTVKEEARVFRENGDVANVTVEFKVLKDHSGHTYKVYGVNQDITERKRAEETLRESRDYLENLLSFANAPIMVWDSDFKITRFNLAFERMTGYAIYDVIGKRSDVLISPDKREAALSFLTRISEGENLISVEMPIRCKGGSVRTILWNTANIYSADNKSITATIALGQDITERKLAEEALQESELRFRSLYENATIGLYRTTPDGKILMANPALVEMLGYSSFEKLAEKNLEQGGFESVAQRKEFLEKIEQDGGVSRFDSKWLHQNGKAIFVLESARAIRDSEGKTMYYDGIVENITERKLLEDQMRQMQKLEGLGTLAGGIAHDFNNILGIILAYSTSIKRFKDDAKKLELAVDTIIKAVDRGKTLVKQILTFARKSETEFSPVDINDLVMEIMAMIQETFPKVLTYTQNCDNAIPFIIADRSQLHQALLNLCVNARDAMSSGGVLAINTQMVSSISIRNQHPDALASSYVCIEVRDTGEGMTEEVRDRIFEPFYTTKEKGKGTGLGLAVVFGVVKTHKGFIEVESDLKKGTTFRLYLPVPSEIMPAQTEIQDLAKEIPGGTETMLVVEDEETLMLFIQISLTAKGYTVLSAVNGPDAVKFYRERQKEISLVFTDLGLPGMTGMEEINLIKKINPDAKIIVATGFLDPEMKSELLKAGVKKFILKPYNYEEILKLVREVLDEK